MAPHRIVRAHEVISAGGGAGEARARIAGMGGGRVLAGTMFLSSFAWSFVFVSLPFHVQAIGADDPERALRWTGWILGISSLTSVLTAPLWGRWAARGDPRALYVAVEGLQGLAFFGMALARTLPELFVVRLLLGLWGAASTFAYIIVGRDPDAAAVRRQVAAVQGAMTVGQVVGPLAGAVAAARLGFRPSFVLGGVILLGCAALVRWGVAVPPARLPGPGRERRPAVREVAAAALIVLVGSTQIFFLTAILPPVLGDLGVPGDETLAVAGLVIFASGAAAALGAVLAPRLAGLAPERRLVSGLLLASSGCLAALGAAPSVWGYGALRFLQVLCIAPVFPLVVARLAGAAGGEAVGLVNAARLAAGFVGPVVATTLLGWTSAPVLYLALAAAGAASAVLVVTTPAPGAAPR